jgi:hypothetical protein
MDGETYRMLMWSYVRWIFDGRPRCLYRQEQPAVKGFFWVGCQERLEGFLMKRRRSRTAS